MNFPNDFVESDFIVDGVRIDLYEFPHIQKEVHRTWGSPYCLKYMNSLIAGTEDRRACVDQRANQRRGQGFPAAFVAKLLNLVEQHPQFPERRTPPDSVFNDWMHQP